MFANDDRSTHLQHTSLFKHCFENIRKINGTTFVIVQVNKEMSQFPVSINFLPSSSKPFTGRMI